LFGKNFIIQRLDWHKKKRACQDLCVKAFDHTGTLPVNLIAS
jgi:hypothetical protein